MREERDLNCEAIGGVRLSIKTCDINKDLSSCWVDDKAEVSINEAVACILKSIEDSSIHSNVSVSGTDPLHKGTLSKTESDTTI